MPVCAFYNGKMGLASELSMLFPGRQRPGIHPRLMPCPLPVLLTLAPGAAEFQPFIRRSIPLKIARNLRPDRSLNAGFNQMVPAKKAFAIL